MSTNSATSPGTIASAQPAAVEAAPSVRKNSYSLKRSNAFDAWQEHIRKSAGAMHGSHGGVTFSRRHDRDLRRAVVAG